METRQDRIPKRMRMVLFTTIETLRIVAILLQPVMPAAMGKLLDLLGVRPSGEASPIVDQEATITGSFDCAQATASPAALPAPAPVFPRYVEPGAAAK